MAAALTASQIAANNAWNAGFDANGNRIQEPAKPFNQLSGGSEPVTSVNPNSQVVQGADGKAYTKLPPQSDGKGGGWLDLSTGQRVGAITLAAKSNVASSVPGAASGGFVGGGVGGGTYGGMSLSSAQGGSAQNPLEFYLGAAPTLEELQLGKLGLPTYAGVGNLQLPNYAGVGNLKLPEYGGAEGLALPNAPKLSGVDYSGVIENFRTTFDQLNAGVTPNFEVDQSQLLADVRKMAEQLNMSPEEIKDYIAKINPSSEEIIADYEKFADTAASTGNKIAAALNEKYQNSFESAMPGYKANMAKANELTSTYLSGKLPQSVVDATVRGAAAKGFTTGLLGGGIGRNLVARDLGLTSLQLQSAGANLLQQTSQIANSVLQATMPVTGAQFADPTAMFSASMSMKRVDPSAIFNSVYTPVSKIFGDMANMAQQSTMARASFEASKMVQPGAVLSTLTQQALYNQQIDMQNQLNNWETSKTMAIQNQQISERNAMTQWSAQRDQNLFNQQLAERNAMTQFGVDTAQAQYNQQLAERTAMTQFETARTQAMTQFDVDVAQAQYNQQIKAQNLMNAYQSQALPGQFDISKGKYVGYQPGTYSDTKPGVPGAAAAKSGGGRAALEAISITPDYSIEQRIQDYQADPAIVSGFRANSMYRGMTAKQTEAMVADKIRTKATAEYQQDVKQLTAQRAQMLREFDITQARNAAYG